MVRPLLVGGAIAAVVVGPYLAIYALNRGVLGERNMVDIRTYSATLMNYLSTPNDNLVHGRWAGPLGQNERRLFPGLLATGLALFGLIGLDRRRVGILLIGAVGLVISLGTNTAIYDALRQVVIVYRGLRAPARAAVLVYVALAPMVAFGWAWIETRLRGPRTAAVVVGALILLEFASPPQSWLTLPDAPRQVYGWLARQPRSLTVEFPLSTADRLHTIYDGLYMFGSTTHWQPILNGYSGFFPPSYIALLEEMKTFPDDRSLAYLRGRNVSLIVIHASYMPPDRFGEMTSALLARSDVETVASFDESRGPDVVFRLKR